MPDEHMASADTILAPASAPGRSDRAIIRISGPGVARLLAEFFEAAPPSRGVSRAALKITESLRLPVLVARFVAPMSYTGEDCLEVLLPGNPNIIERVCSRLLSFESARYAHPGEFTARAYLSGKMSLDEAEGVAATIAARNLEELDAACAIMRGDIGARYRSIADDLSTVLSLVEAGIDFTDQEDVVAIPATDLARRLTVLREAISTLIGSGKGRAAEDPTPRVVLAGAPNAGKSTLFNALLGRTRASASPIEGTTRDVLAEPLDLSRDSPGSGVVMLCDAAGLTEPGSCARRSESDRRADEAARDAISGADVVVWCDPSGRFDARRGPLDTRASVIRVRTFGDRPVSSTSLGAVEVCALDGWNLSVLRRAIADQATTARGAGPAALLPRHRAALFTALTALASARDTLGSSGTIEHAEKTAAALRLALDAVGELVGRISPDDVLGRVFATFCVGK